MEIILIRHGKPTSATNPVINALEYTRWVRRYNASLVANDHRPTKINSEYKSCYVISSDLKRAIHSAHIYTGSLPLASAKLYREIAIPRYKLPFILNAWVWVLLSRILWILGLKGSFESYKQAKQRADLAAEHLISLAQEHDKVVLFGHGYMNRYIRKSLIQKAWKLDIKSNQYWGITRLKN